MTESFMNHLTNGRSNSNRTLRTLCVDETTQLSTYPSRTAASEGPLSKWDAIRFVTAAAELQCVLPVFVTRLEVGSH